MGKGTETMGCEGYGALASVYEQLNSEIDYVAWADYVEKKFDAFLSKRPTLVLDLACGTGTMTRELSRRGYDMIGVDGSADMLSQAMMAGQPHPILYLEQDMRSFELYGTVGATVCCLDSINYLLAPDDVQKTFSLVYNYLDPDGLFLFDINTPYKFECVYGDNDYILEDEENGVYCGWQNHYDRETQLCDFDLSIFTPDAAGKYRRYDEHQMERCYARKTMETLLKNTGFELLSVDADFFGNAPNETAERWYFTARCKK